jgi:CRISPR-associated endoribonuclease Cas6
MYIPIGGFYVLLKVTLKSDKPSFVLPCHYNRMIQAALYKVLEPDFATFLHKEGFIHGKRSFKLFTFSQIQGKYQLLREEKKIHFFNPVTLTVCSPISSFCKGVMNAILNENGIRLGQVQLNVAHVESRQPQVKDQTIVVKTLSPITVYSTLLRPDGRKYTAYYHPLERDFAKQIQRNILKKFELVYQTVPSSSRFNIEPVGRVQQRILFYKENLIKGYVGKFKLSADDPKLLSLALDTGLGAKGSQGFGCIEQVDVQEGEKAC